MGKRLITCLSFGFAIVVGLFAVQDSSLTSFASSNTAPKEVYHRWLNEDVAYIITSNERKAFNLLKTDEQREAFIEQFWRRRDPNPSTDKNEYREEYYSRIAYANENFTSSVPGWKTDRGRIYITFGKPDKVESLSAGISSTPYPREVWFYNRIPGFGQNVKIDFVDLTGKGEYRISPESEKALTPTKP